MAFVYFFIFLSNIFDAWKDGFGWKLADLRSIISQHVMTYVNVLIINDNIVSCSYAAFRSHIYNCILHLAKKCCTSHNVWQYFKKWWFPIIQVRFAAFCCIVIMKSTNKNYNSLKRYHQRRLWHIHTWAQYWYGY